MTWYNEPRRHSLASKGIKTTRKIVVIPENVMVRLRKDKNFSDSILTPETKENIWESLPTRSWSVNPKEIFVKTYRKGNIYIHHRTFPENNIIEVWKENRNTKIIYPTKTFKDNFEEYKKSMALVNKMMGKNKKIKYV